MNEIALIAGMALVTFMVRYPILALFSRIELPKPVIRALRYVPVAVLTAISLPEMVYRDGAPLIALTNAHLIAGIIAIGIAWYTRQLLPTIVIGMIAFFVIRALTGV